MDSKEEVRKFEQNKDSTNAVVQDTFQKIRTINFQP